MQLIDLSREIYHKMPRIMTHPPIIITPFGTHQEIREADGYKFSSSVPTLSRPVAQLCEPSRVAAGDCSVNHLAARVRAAVSAAVREGGDPGRPVLGGSRTLSLSRTSPTVTMPSAR